MTTRATRSPRRRTVVALAVVLAVLVAFVVRLVDIQVVNAAGHRAASIDSIGFTTPIYGTRGTIVDESGALLAGNLVQYDAAIDPYNVATQVDKDKEYVAAELWPEQAAEIAEIIGLPAEAVQALVDPAYLADPVALSRDKDEAVRWAQLAKGLSTTQYRALAELDHNFLSFSPHPARTYPDGAVAGNLIGFVGSDGTPLAGIEAWQDECLAATNGEQSYQYGTDGVIIPGTTVEKPATDGGTLQLTINRDLQWFMQQLIAEQVQNQNAQYGTVFVVEVKTGKIRAAAEYPTVDPNDVTSARPEDLGSRIFTHQFEPGSTFKPVTAATIIEEGKATPTSPIIPAAGREELNGITINDVFSHDTFQYTLAGALVDSSNVALSKFGDLVSEEVRAEYLKKFGVGTGTAVDFPGEAQGIINPTPWDPASHWTSTFGQSFTVTVPQVASVYQTLANGGRQLPLRLIESCTSADGEVIEPDLPEPVQVVSEKTADQVSLMMENVYQQVENHDVIEVAGYRAATKTGTAQKTDGAGGYKNGVWYTTLAGFAPADDPQYAVILTLDEPLNNRMSAANAPGWGKAMTQVLKAYHVLPSTEPGPEILPKYQ